MATVWPALLESSHGAGKAGEPSPGDQTSWEAKTELNIVETADYNLEFTQCLIANKNYLIKP